MSNTVTFKAPKVISEFMRSNARIRVIEGPFRSGKSVGCMVEIVRRAKEQARGKDGFRHSRWAVVRNTMRMLNDTTIKTWKDWFIEGQCGYWRETGKTFFLEFGDVKAEIIFRPLDDAQDMKNLLSLDLTGAYINEAREIPREIIEGLDGRISQYPKMADGGCTWAGIWMDTNPPEEGSYLWSMLEGYDPESGEPRANEWHIFKQPGGMVRAAAGEPYDVELRCGWKLRANPDADNVGNLVKGYYSQLAHDKSDEYVKVYIMGLYGQSKAGKPVHPLFDKEFHVAKHELIPNPLLPLIISGDWGLTPALVLGQQDTFGRVLILDEIVTENMGLKRAIEERLQPLLRRKYHDFKIHFTGDPSGANRSQSDESSCIDIIRRSGFKSVKLAYSNTPVHRVNDMDSFLARRTEHGAAFLISPQCTALIRGMGGGYAYKIARNGITNDVPEKNMSSHICESAQYLMMSFSKGNFSAETVNNRKEWLQQVQNQRTSYSRRN